MLYGALAVVLMKRVDSGFNLGDFHELPFLFSCDGFRAACSLAIRSASCLRKAPRVGGTWFCNRPMGRLVKLI